MMQLTQVVLRLGERQIVTETNLARLEELIQGYIRAAGNGSRQN